MPGSATAYSTQGPGWRRPSRIGRRARYRRTRAGMPPRIGQKLRHYDRVVWAALCHAPPVQDGDGEVPAGAGRSRICAERGLAIRGRQAHRARAGSGDGRQLLRPGRPSPRPVSASASRAGIPGMTVRDHHRPVDVIAPADNRRVHVPDHQLLAVLTVLAREVPPGGRRKLARPGPDSRPRRGNGGSGRVSGLPASGHGPHRPGDRGAIPAPPGWPGVAAASAAQVTAASQRGAAGGTVAGHGGNRGGAGQGHVPVPHRDRAGGPEPGVTLLAPGAGQSAEGVDAPAGIDRAGAGVGFAERCRIGMPADARAHLAPHDRHPQLIADHSPHRGPGRASRPWSGQRAQPGQRG